MIVNLRSKLKDFWKLNGLRKWHYVNPEGISQAPVFTMGEYRRLCETHGIDWVQNEQVRRRADLWTPQQERRWRSLRAELRHIVG